MNPTTPRSCEPWPIGSEEALAALYDRHVDGVHAVALRSPGDRQLAEEVVQETFLALWNRAELFDPSLASLATWLRTIARNRTVDRIRAARRRPPIGRPRASAASPARRDRPRAARASALGPGRRGPDPAPRRRPRLGTCSETVRQALATMPDDERAVILLAYRDGLTQAEIAERLEWPLGTVKTRTRRALGRLRVALEADEQVGRIPRSARARRDGW